MRWLRTYAREIFLAILALVIVLALFLAPTSTTVAPRAKPAAPVSGHPCTTANDYFQCKGPLTPTLTTPVVPTPPSQIPPALRAPTAFGFSALYGVDFAWGGPSGSTARAHGAHFGASYLSLSSKDWNPGTLRSYLANGLGVVFVWETAAARPLAGWNAGYNDAFNATREVRLNYGLALNRTHIDFAADFDSSAYGRAFVPYYQGAAAWDRRVGVTTGAYGGLHTVLTLCQAHVTTQNWQTVAWSGGVRLSSACAPLYQESINNFLGGSSVDNDIATAANYGQYGAAPPKPRLRCFGPHAQTHNATCKRVRAEVGQWSRAAASSRRVAESRACPLLERRVRYFEHAVGAHPHSRLTKHRRAALTATRRAVSGRKCRVFDGRAAFYEAKIHKALATY